MRKRESKLASAETNVYKDVKGIMNRERKKEN